MRDLALIIVLLGIIPIIFFRPHVGVLAWAWVSLMNPHREVYSYLQGANLNFIIACLTFVSLIFSSEKRLPRFSSTFFVIVLFAIWTSVTTFEALNYPLSSELWLRTMKTFIFLILICALLDRP